MPEAPENHVTEAMRIVVQQALAGAPEVPRELVDWLQRLYPPRCLMPNETVEDHLRYAGMVELVQTLAAIAEQQRREFLELDEEDE